MAVRKNSFDELSSWWTESQEQLAAEHYVETNGYHRIGSDLLFIQTYGSDNRQCAVFPELWEGIPVLAVREWPFDENKVNKNRNRSLYDVIGLDMGTDVLSSALPEGHRLSRSEQVAILKSVREHYPVLVSRLDEGLKRMRDAVMLKYGFDRRRAIVNAIIGDILLDESSVNSGNFYAFARDMSREELASTRQDIEKEVDNYVKLCHEEGRLSREDAEAMLSFNRKAVADRFHDWSIQKGKMNHYLGSLSAIREEIRPEIIAKVAVWAEKDKAMVPYLGANLESWVEGKCKAFHIDVKTVNDFRQKMGGHVNIVRSRPQLSAKDRRNVRKQFSIG